MVKRGIQPQSGRAPSLHPLQRRYLAEDLVRLRRADEKRRHVASQRRGRIDPNPHQIDAVMFALRRVREGGCILADEVGLGKTIEAGLVIAQLLAEGARRILVILPKPLLGQWRQELFDLFGIEVREGPLVAETYSGSGVFLIGREIAGSEPGADVLQEVEPFDLCVIDEAHEVFSGIYRRFGKSGDLTLDSPHAKRAARVRSFLGETPVLLLTATPMQNSLTELWGLAQYVEPTGTLLGNLPTFRQVFCDGDDRQLVSGQEQELRRRMGMICQRTLRRQAQEFLERPFVNRRAQLFEYTMTAAEKELYEDVTRYLLQPDLVAFRGNHRRLLLIGFHRRMASSLPALAASLHNVAARLRGLQERFEPGELDAEAAAVLSDLEEEVEAVEDRDVDEGARPGIEAIREELQLVESLERRARELPHDSKAEAMKRAVRIVLERAERGEGKGKLVIFTESLATQDYLRELLLETGVDQGEITVFRGQNNSPRARQALDRWQQEQAAVMPAYNRPSPAVAMRLALVHEFKTRSKVLLATEAGAKGLNLQFCDTIINYDLPWNPQRIEQRIGRCHRYSQTHDVTVINFLASDNDAQRLTFEILSQKLDLFGTVLDASDAVLHEPSTRTPETLAGVLGTDFEHHLRRIYEQAGTVEEIEVKLREFRDTMGDERKRFEEALERTRGLIESRLDEKVRGSFAQIQEDLPQTLADFDRDLDRLIGGYLAAQEIDHQRSQENGHVFYRVAASDRLPEALRSGLTVVIGPAANANPGDPVHLGHPLVQAAVQESRHAAVGLLRVRFHQLPAGSPLLACRGRRGRLQVWKLLHTGFEPVERLVPVVLLEGDQQLLPESQANALLELAVSDLAQLDPPLSVDEEDLEDAVEEMQFLEQSRIAAEEHEHFARTMDQLERFVEDQILVLQRQVARLQQQIEQGQQQRDAAVGAAARSEAEKRLRRLDRQSHQFEQRIQKLQARDDPRYEKWRDWAHEKHFAKPEHRLILDAEFQLE
jgi:hypothetical protein